MDRFIGIDVSQDTLDVASWPEPSHQKLPNTPAAITQLIRRLKREPVTLVVFEPTNHYHDLLAKLLGAAKLPYHLANPYRARQFAQGIGHRAKTDKLDAAMLAEYGVHLKATPLSTAETEALAALVRDRRHWVEQRKVEKTRRHSASGLSLQLITRAIAHYTKAIATVDNAIQQFLDQHPAFAERETLLRTAKGVGRVVAITLLGELPELATTDRQEIAALVGVAPYDHSSGKRRGKSLCWGGRAAVRAVLYEGTVAATRSNPRIKPFYERLLAAGKDKKLALVACLRKLLTILQAMVQTNEVFRSLDLPAT